MSDDLTLARRLIDVGTPVFVLKRNPSGVGRVKGTPYDSPPGWQRTPLTPRTLDGYRPGDALGAVGGHALDFIDVDRQHGGDITAEKLTAAWPREYLRVVSPSGGFHSAVARLDLATFEGYDGIDLRGGLPDGTGRGFVFIPPTTKIGKTDGLEHGYIVARDALDAFGMDDHTGAAFRSWALAHPGRGADTAAESSKSLDLGATGPRIGDVLPAGQQDAMLTRYAASVVARSRGRYDRDELTTLVAAYGQGCEPPWGHAGGERLAVAAAGKVDSALRKFLRVDDQAGDTELATRPVADRILTTQQLSLLPPPKALIPGYLYRDTLAWIAAAPGSYKTILSIHFAACVANGQRCILPTGWVDVEGGKVLYVSGEGASGLYSRVSAWTAVYGLQAKYGKGEPDILWLPEAVQVSTHAWDHLIEYCGELKPALVVLDTQSRMTVGLDENDAKSSSVVVDRLDALRRASGACVLTNHHSSKAGMTLRGSSVIDGAADTVIGLERPDEDDPRVVVRCVKQKDAAPFAKFWMQPVQAAGSIVLEKAEPLKVVKR